jgi:flagellar basal body P-ring formation protein FlgA
MKNWMAYTLAALAALACVQPARAADPGDRVYVFLRNAAKTTTGQITLGEVAEVEGFDRDLVGRLTGLPLGPAPQPGEKVTLNREEIRRSMAIHSIDPVKVALTGSDRVEVQRGGRIITREEIASLVEDYFRRSWEGEPVRTELAYPGLPDSLSVSDANFDLKVLTPLRPRVSGSLSLSLALTGDGLTAQRLPVSVKCRVFQNVAVATRLLRQGSLLEPEDFEFAEHEIEELRSSPVKSAVEAAGKRLRRSVREGQVITVDLLENQPIIERGDEVTLIVQYKTITVGCSGKAWENGGMGDRILVRNQYGKNLIGTVQDAHTVLINFERTEEK